MKNKKKEKMKTKENIKKVLSFLGFEKETVGEKI